MQKAGNNLLITSVDANNDVLVLESIFGLSSEREFVATIEVVSGSIQFNVGAACGSDNATLAAGEKILMAFGANLGNINFKAGAGSQTFRICFA
jgi:hypothetical protein